MFYYSYYHIIINYYYLLFYYFTIPIILLLFIIIICYYFTILIFLLLSNIIICYYYFIYYIISFLPIIIYIYIWKEIWDDPQIFLGWRKHQSGSRCETLEVPKLLWHKLFFFVALRHMENRGLSQTNLKIIRKSSENHQKIMRKS